MDFKNTYANQKVLVTGADGFIGSHLTERLLELGSRVVAVIKDCHLVSGSNQQKLYNLEHVRDRIKIIAGDIASPDTTDLIKHEEPAYIFHLAAEAYVNKSFVQPREVIRTNLDGTLNVLHAGLDESRRPEAWLRQMVCTSSSEIYGSHDTPIDEDYPLNPSSPYGASKAAADRIAYSYFNTFGLPVAIIRPFNTYGPRHTYDAPPKFISLALEGKDITVYGDGLQTRDLSYVDDTVDGFLTMGSRTEAVGQAVNFGTGSDTTIIDLARLIIDLTGSKSRITQGPPRASEVRRLCSNPQRAFDLFGWKSRVSLADGLTRNIEYVQGRR